MVMKVIPCLQCQVFAITLPCGNDDSSSWHMETLAPFWYGVKLSSLWGLRIKQNIDRMVFKVLLYDMKKCLLLRSQDHTKTG